jgi:hypothetical protein
VSYDISDPAKPVLAGRVWLGGSIVKGGGVTVPDPADLAALGLEEQPERPVIKGVPVQVRGPKASAGGWGADQAEDGTQEQLLHWR